MKIPDGRCRLRVRTVVGACLLATMIVGTTVDAQQSLPPELFADTVLYNGKVLTADATFTIAQAVAIRDGKILAVGDDARILSMAGARTTKVDLAGKTVTPGFIDTHFHLYNYAANPATGGKDYFPGLLPSDLKGNMTKEALLAVLREKAPSWPRRDGWVLFCEAQGANKRFEFFLFHRVTMEELDAIFPNEPAALGASHGNNYSYYVVNSVGLKRIAERVDINSPGFQKDPRTGKHTGLILRPDASAVGEEIMPWPDIPHAMGVLQSAITKYNATGRTMIQTKTPGYVMAALRELWAGGELNMRWRAQLKGFDNVGTNLEGLLKRMGNLSGLGDGMLRIASGAGGVPAEEWDKTYSKPRIPLKETGPSEEAANAAEGVDRGTYTAVKYGWSLANIHSQGDRGNDAFLQQVEEGLRDRLYEARNQRFGLDHGQMITAHSPKGSQIDRIAKIGVMVPSLNIGKMLRQGSYEAERQLTDDPNILKLNQINIYEAKWGREQVYQMLPAKSLIKAGVHPSLEADSFRWPEVYPLWSMEKLITRKDDFEGAVWGQYERVTRQEALWMATKWAADYTGEASVMGSIEPGKYADLVVMDRDFMTVPEDEISHIRVLTTYLNGRVVYDAAKDGSLETIYPPARNHWTKAK